MRTCRGRDERGVVWFGSRVGERSFEGTVLVCACGRKARVIKRDSKSVAIFRSIDVSVVAVVWDELVEFSEGYADEKFKGGFHNDKVKKEVENYRVFRGVKALQLDRDITDSVGDLLYLVVCHAKLELVRKR